MQATESIIDPMFWQLDSSNDFWLRADKSESKMLLSCRYPAGAVILDPMVKLFRARFGR